MSHNKALDDLTREQLTELLEIYSKNWLAADGIWFQSVEKKHGMEEAMYHDVEIWKKFTVVEALKLKKFLRLPERPGLEGLAKALSLRFYANINDDEIRIEGNTLLYRMVDCRVQTARKRKGMELWNTGNSPGLLTTASPASVSAVTRRLRTKPAAAAGNLR